MFPLIAVIAIPAHSPLEMLQLLPAFSLLMYAIFYQIFLITFTTWMDVICFLSLFDIVITFPTRNISHVQLQCSQLERQLLWQFKVAKYSNFHQQLHFTVTRYQFNCDSTQHETINCCDNWHWGATLKMHQVTSSNCPPIQLTLTHFCCWGIWRNQ